MSNEPQKIHWKEAEALAGCRLDRRVNYWRQGDNVLIMPRVTSVPESQWVPMPPEFAELEGQGPAWPLIYDPDYKGRFDIAHLVELPEDWKGEDRI